MAGSKIRALTEATSPASTDLVHVVVNPAGTPADRKVKLSNLRTAIGAQPVDSDLTAIAALTTTSYGRALLALADAAALRTAAGLGTAAVVNTGTSGANVPTVTQADARYQPLDSDLTAIAALSTTSYGRAFLALADAAAARTAIDAQQAGTSVAKDQTATAAQVITFQTIQSSDHGAFTWVYDENHVFSTTRDPVMFFGYNVGASGAQASASYASIHQGFEGDYNTGSYHSQEWYVQHVSLDGTKTRRPISFTIDQAAGANYILGSIAATQFSFFDDDGTTALAYIDRNIFRFNTSFQLLYSGADGFVLAPVSASITRVTLNAKSGTSLSGFYFQNVSGTNYHALGINTNDNSGALVVKPSDASLAGVVVRGLTSQAGSLWEAQDVNSVLLSKFNKNGYFITAKVAAPADAELAASQMALWLDATNGAAKLMVKAKTANGTVATGSLALA